MINNLGQASSFTRTIICNFGGDMSRWEGQEKFRASGWTQEEG